MANQLPQIPLDVVERIQGFMSYRDATRSACTCTQLYQSWYKRNHIELDERTFNNASDFWRVGMEVIRRYQNADLKLKKFIIRMVSAAERDQFSAEMIEGAAKLGAKEITIILYDRRVAYRIPPGVFESDDLVMLKVLGGALRLDEEIPVICSSLKFLALLPALYVDVENDILHNYLLKCPSLISLKCRGFLVRYSTRDLCLNRHNLKSLCVETLNNDDHFWITYLIAILTDLKLLVIRNIPTCINFIIRSNSLQVISIEERRSPVIATMVVPNIIGFQYIGIPSSTFDFKSCLSRAVCWIKVDTHPHIDKWFRKLHSLLDALSCSAIHLSVTSLSSDPIPWDDAEHVFDRIKVEVLDISNVVTQCPSMLDNLLRVCEPTMTQPRIE